MLLPWRHATLSVKSYAIVFIAVVALLFGFVSWAMLSKIAATRVDITHSNHQAARAEISDTLAHLHQEVARVGQFLVGWDETRQQLGDPAYYTYWRDNRALEGGIVPTYVNAVELYSRLGKPLADKLIANMPPQASGEAHAWVTRQGERDHLYFSSPIRDDHGLTQLSGYVVVRLDLLPALQTLQHFRYVDAGSLSLPLREGERIPLEQVAEKLAFSLVDNEEIASLLEAMSRFQYLIVFMILAISALAYFALASLMVKPLLRLTQHIDALRGGGSLMLESLGGGLPVRELEKVRLSLNDYQAQLDAMHASLDEKNNELWSMAHRDPLSGVFNRRCFDEDWRLVLSVAAGHRVDVSFLLFDCDHFKPINDTYGHHTGDQVLQVIAQMVQRTLRAGDRLYRLGGDEFATIFLDATPEHALEVARRCVEAVDRYDFSTLGIKEPIRISVGIAQASGTRAEDLATLQKQADVAMYHAKRPGYGKIVAYTEDMASGNAMVSNQATNAVFEAIASGVGLEMHYQPVVSLPKREIDYYEALARIRCGPELILPGAIFPVVEARRLEAEFDFSVMERILADLASGMIPRGRGVSINISGPAIVHPRINEKLAPFESFLKDYKLVLEITETALITQLQQASANLNRLRAAGFVVALDDFGSGYSSLGYMANMPVDVVKFDISLIRSLGQDDRHGGIVEGLTLMIRKAGYDIVAEGIETERTLNAVNRLGFTHGQGYLLGRPEAGISA